MLCVILGALSPLSSTGGNNTGSNGVGNGTGNGTGTNNGTGGGGGGDTVEGGGVWAVLLMSIYASSVVGAGIGTFTIATLLSASRLHTAGGAGTFFGLAAAVGQLGTVTGTILSYAYFPAYTFPYNGDNGNNGNSGNSGGSGGSGGSSGGGGGGGDGGGSGGVLDDPLSETILYVAGGWLAAGSLATLLFFFGRCTERIVEVADTKGFAIVWNIMNFGNTNHDEASIRTVASTTTHRTGGDGRDGRDGGGGRDGRDDRGDSIFMKSSGAMGGPFTSPHTGPYTSTLHSHHRSLSINSKHLRGLHGQLV